MIPTSFAALTVVGAFFIGYVLGKWSEVRYREVEEDE